jgi:aromatic-L-amino-acid/L-tryptophan decarboxylase
VVLRQAVTDVLGPAMRVDHPRFFAYAPIPSNYRRVADAMLVDELATLSSTVLDGRTTLRLCTVNPRATREDVEATLARVEELAATV